jgi:LCP family protein required for cell wall assembly
MGRMNHSGATGVPRRTRLRRPHWLVLGGALLCMVLVGGALLYLSPVLALLNSHDPAAGKPGAATVATPPPLDSKERINILLLGSDNDQKFPQNAVLSQTMIVVSIDPSSHQVTLLSLPRDLWVEIPGHKSAKIDLAYAQGGAPLARAAVEKAFKVPVHYYAWIGLNGLIRVVDRVGGVDVDVLHPVLDDNYPNDFSNNGYGTERVFLSAGPQHLDGRHTLQYVRSRHGDLLSDLGRSIRQQQVLLAIQQRTAGMDFVTQLPIFARDLNGHLKTDLDLVRLTQLALLMRGLRAGDVHQAFLTPYVHDAVSSDGQQILLADWPAVHAYLRQLFGGDLLP